MYRPLLAAIFATSASAAPLPLAKGPLVAVADDSPASTVITAYPSAEKNPETPPLATLRIDWLNQSPAPTGFEVVQEPGTRLIRSTHHLGRTQITRTILATGDAIYLHVLADQPGALSFRTTLQVPRNEKTTIEDRRELGWTSSGDPAAKARAWVIPFESDVEADGPSIVLRGEGECLVIFNFSAAEKPGNPISGTWSRIAAAFDPGSEPPDPSKIWQAILSRETAP